MATRRTTTGGTRRRIMEQAARLCLERSGADPSVADIARAAGVYPNQITYHFGSKDSLMVHAAFLGLLNDAKRVEKVGARATDADAFRRNVSRAVLAMPSLPSVSRALAAAIARPELTHVVDTHLQLLFRQSEVYLSHVTTARGWNARRPLGLEARTFWSTALGATLLSRAGFSGDSADLDLAGTLTIHD
ncbi:TetR family transcriptional regulator [Kineosporia sp. J2-2]|uniref:TetR family transcriptional regulator n=1 Tax=Kineosporia corallincola TaxID=2835133 RepID=A0ABS5TBN1_9ACTN|nr:TetR/AcrR family transcriptional regulator C-terminal domain-containing protein [Kineosporia corallincola]MBT0768485.1 TetR family transcriptional regulator [Kineosporia corallincola]